MTPTVTCDLQLGERAPRPTTLYVLSAKDLSVLAQNELGDSSAFNASPALCDGQIFIRSNDYLYCIGAKK